MKRNLYFSGLMLFIILVATSLFTACTNETTESLMYDGDYEGIGEGRSGIIKVLTHIEEHKITDIKILSQSESKFAQPSENEIIANVILNNGIEGVDIVTGATLTSNGIIEAIGSSIEASKGIKKTDIVYSNTTCDMVVIGAGGAGLTAAVEAASKGVNVIVLEKQHIIGGNTLYSTGGINAAETSIQKGLGITDSKKLFFDDTMIGGKNLNDTSLVWTFVNNAPSSIEWLINLHADLSDVGKMAGSSVKRTHRPQGGSAIGPHLMAILQNANKEKNIEIRKRNKVTDIITDENGAVAGVTVETPNGTYTINTKCVIIATGGFGANINMISSYKPEYNGFSTSNHSGATGDAFAWVSKWNVPLILMDKIQIHPTGEIYNHLLITEAVRGNGAILVNKKGNRFANEMLTRDELSNAILTQDTKKVFIVFDQGIRNSLAAIENYAQQGLLTQADSLYELATLINLPIDTFVHTIHRYNKYQTSGTDLDFGRKADDMPRTLNNPPYYAIEVEPVIHHTMGGIKINDHAQVVRSNGSPITGLYSAGEVTGGVHGGNRLGGNGVADVVVFGRIAGQNAAEFVLQD